MVLISYLCMLVYGEIGTPMIGYMWGCFTLANFVQYFIAAVLFHILASKYILWIFSFTTLIGLIMGSVIKYQGKW